MATAKDYRTDAEVVWCAGCGDFGVMAALAKALAKLAIPNENIAFISGIGCSSRIPGYFDVFGFNTLHGRALPVAQGVKLARPELTVVVATGDGDALAIGAGHFLHAARRNTDMTVLLFDNQVYGLTKGQASPTTPMGDKMQLAAYGVHEEPIRPLSLGIHCGATFAGRGFSGDPKGLQKLIVQAIEHRGFSLVQILSPCVTFRGKWDPFQTIRDHLSAVPDDHDPDDRVAAIRLSDDVERIYAGVLYRHVRPTFGDLLNRIGELAEPEQAPPIEQVLEDFVH